MINVLKQQGEGGRYGPWILNWTGKCRQRTKTKMEGRLSDWRSLKIHRTGITGVYCYPDHIYNTVKQDKYSYAGSTEDFSNSHQKLQTLMRLKNLVKELRSRMA